MGQQYADVCDECHRTVVKVQEADSSDMVAIEELDLLYLSDEYLPGKHSRPSLYITGGRYCPDCFLKMLEGWVLELETLKRSRINEVVEKGED